MRRALTYFTAVVMLVGLMLVLSAPAERRVKADGQTLQEKCDDCSIRNQRQFEHCLAIHGEDHIPCYDQFNAGVVHCFRNFCEQ
jgi:hypothetical protein